MNILHSSFSLIHAMYPMNPTDTIYHKMVVSDEITFSFKIQIITLLPYFNVNENKVTAYCI